MKKFLIVFLAVVVLAIAGLSFMFYRAIDEENYKQQIIASTKELTGSEMVVGGEVKIQLFPSPVIRMSNVTIKNRTGFPTDTFMKIASVEAHIRFSSLFKNPMIIDNIILKEPQVFLQRNEKGENNWNFTFLRQKDKALEKDNMLGQTFSDVPPQFQNMTLEKGSISYQNALSGVQYQLTDLNGKMTSQSVMGPFDFSGSMKSGIMPLKATLHIEKLNVSAQTKFTLLLENPNSKADISIPDGKIERLSDIGQAFSGGFTFRVPNLSAFLVEQRGFKDLPEQLNKSIIGNGKFSLTSSFFELKEIAARYGDDVTQNAVAADINFIFPKKVGEKTKLTSSLRFSQLNLDMFVPYLPKSYSWKNMLDKIAQIAPKEMDMVAEADEITLFKQGIKNFALSFNVRDNEMEVKELKAQLPQETSFKTAGLINLDTANPVIQMNLSIRTDHPQQTFDWLGYKLLFDLEKVTQVNLNSNLRVRTNDLTLTDLVLTTNDSTVKGGLAFSLTEPDLTGYVSLNLEKVNFDNFFPYTAPTQNRTVKEWLSDIKNSLEKSVLFDDINVGLTLSGQDITFKSLPMEQIAYEGKIENKDWQTTSLKISQAAQSNIEYRGSIHKLDDGSLYLKDVEVALEMPKSLLLLDRLKVQSPIVKNSSKINLKAAMSGSFDKMEIDSDIVFTQGRINAKGTLEKIFGQDTGYALQVKISHPNFHQFMRLFDSSFKKFPTLSGNFTVDGLIKGAPNQMSLINTDIAIGAQKAHTDLNLTRTENGVVSATGTITSPYLYLDKFISKSNFLVGVNAHTGKSEFPTDLLKFDALDNLSLDMRLSAEKIGFEKMELSLFNTHISLDNKILILDDGKATVDGGSVDFYSVLNCSTATPFIKGNIKMDGVPVRPDLFTMGMFRLKSGSTSLMMDFDTKGNSIDDMLKSLSSTGRFTIKNGAVSSLNLNAFEHRIRATLARKESLDNLTSQLNREITVGETPFDFLEGSFAITNGLFRTSDTVLRSEDASAIIQANFDMPEWQITSSAAVTFKNFTGYPSVSIVVKGPAHKPQTSIDFSSFVKQLDMASADIKSRLLKQEQAKQAEQAREEAKDRITQIAELLAKAEQQVLQTEQAMQINNDPMQRTELIRAKDALVLLQELAKKPAPSIADAQKASTQAALIESRTSGILGQISQKAVVAIRESIAKIDTEAQQKMHMVHKVQQRLAGVELIEQAYQKAFSTKASIQQLLAFANQSTDLTKLQQAQKQAQEALNIMDLTYESIAKFDVDAIMEAGQSSGTVQGSIRRN